MKEIKLIFSDKVLDNVSKIQELTNIKNKTTITAQSIRFLRQVLELLKDNNGSKLYIEHSNGDKQEITFDKQ